ncbi:Crp/Fnr family transcriptional regulator [Rhizobium laguerreae]|uniref:Crp/Fnr family transcriptional regulator n=1 Tax=Rhizobium laguerreae TaxID=1076926 RepID=UPI001C91A7A0|nr:Crp/Fnr family transcriptional regulator [Rhizobium laguerreae]MBY3366827.1 Crp/Fnr family transcriptional regulator [Rhizobium laguerreae]
MAAPQQSFMANRLLARLPEADYQAVAPYLEFCDLPKGAVLARQGEPVDHVHFPVSGIGSVVVVTAEGNRAEAGLFGFEGYVPAHAAAGIRKSPHEVIAQIEGGAYRLEFDIFVTLIDTNKAFRTLVQRSVAAYTIQLSHTAASNALHEVSERLARWLLMCDDRIKGRQLPLTHEFMAIMLAVRRPSVTTALHILEGNRFIKAERSLITIRDREAMEEFAKDAYGGPEEQHRLLMEACL